MICPTCGVNNLEGATVCSSCGNPLNVQPAAAGFAQPAGPGPAPAPAGVPAFVPPAGAPTGLAGPVPNYFIFAILVTLFGCMPGGIVALIFSSQVNTKAALGDLAGAREAAQKAKLWCWISAGLGVLVWGLVILMVVLSVVLGVAAH